MFGRTSGLALAPSSIHFLQVGESGPLSPDDAIVEDLSARLTHSNHGGKPPKIQVAEKEGKWFALNNSSLRLFRELEKHGKCPRVQVDVVPLSKVPESVQTGMWVVAEEGGQETRKGYHKVQTSDRNKTKVNECSSPSSSSTSSEDEEDNTDDSGEDDKTCGVCEETFVTSRQLVRHQRKNKHFACPGCDLTFSSLCALEEHKDGLEHWSEEESSDGEDEATGNEDGRARKELERLL